MGDVPRRRATDYQRSAFLIWTTPESSPDGWIGRYDAAIGLSKFLFFCPDEIHEFDLGSWILKNAEKIPYENRVILRLLCAISLFSELCSAFFYRFRIQIRIQFYRGPFLGLNRIGYGSGYETVFWIFFPFFCPKARNLSTYPAIGTALWGSDDV